MIKQRGASFQADFRIGGKRIRRDFPTRAEAQAFEDETKDLERRGQPVPVSVGLSERMTLGELSELTYLTHWKGTRSQSTAVRNSQDVVDAFGKDTDPNTIDEREIDRVVAVWVKRGWSHATCNRKLAALSKIIRLGYRRGWVRRRPLIERTRETQGRIRVITKEEEGAVLNWLVNHGRYDFADYVTLLIDTGLRRNEGLGVEWSDVRDGRLTINEGKTSSAARTIKLTTRCQAILERRRQLAEEGEALVFPSFTRNTVDHDFKRVRGALGLEDDKEFVLHALRRTFISRLVMAGADLMTVKTLAGHKSLLVTQRYAHLSGAQLDHGIEKLEASRQQGFFPADRLVTTQKNLENTCDQAVSRLDT